MHRTLFAAPARGISLLELLIVLLLFAVVLVLGAPVLGGLVQENRLYAGSQRLVVAISLARTEAVMRNAVVTVCPSSMASTGEARCNGDYAQGWLVFADTNGDAVMQPGVDRLLRVFEGLPPGFAVTNRRGTRVASEAINYLPDGSAHRNLTLQVCAPQGRSVSVVLNIVGRARLVRDWGSCPGLA